MASFLLVLRWILQECGDFTWMVSDLWRISGGYSQEMMGLELWRLLLWLTERTFYGVPTLSGLLIRKTLSGLQGSRWELLEEDVVVEP